MKLLSLLSSLVLESDLKRKFLGKTKVGGDEIKFFTSPHQYSDRFGQNSFDEVRNYYFTVLDKGAMDEDDIRFAVPDNILRQLLPEKIEQIKDGFINNPNSYKIRFVFRDENNEFEEKFDYIEFVLTKSKDMKSFTVVTSAYSDNGEYLRRMGRYAEQDPKVILERFDLLLTIYL